MTMLTLLTEAQASTVLRASLGSDPAEVTGVADLLREEVSARGISLRSTTIARVCRFVAPVVTLDTEFVSDICDSLEREGDFVAGPGGALSSTPLRAIDLGGGVFRFACSLPTRRLTSLVPGAWEVEGTSRSCRGENADLVREAVILAGGAVLSPSSWARLDRTPPADEQWLSSLDRRLQAEAEPPASLDRDEHLAWSGCVATPEGVRWRADSTGMTARLWRTRNRWGHWHYAWTREGSPATSAFVSLRPDEGARSYFAVARASAIPVEVTVERGSQDAVLTLFSWLPAAEYRYLALSASVSRGDRRGNRWSIPAERLTVVLDVLRTRLGLVVREDTTR